MKNSHLPDEEHKIAVIDSAWVEKVLQRPRVLLSVGLLICGLTRGVAAALQNEDDIDSTLHAIVRTGQKTFVAVGSRGRIVLFPGADFVIRRSNVGTTLRGVSFSDSKKGIVVGDSGTILRTIDGGVSWEQQLSGTDVALSGISFFDESHTLAAGKRGTILRSNDGGKSWAALSTGTPYSLNFIRHVNTSTAVAVGIEGTVLRTSDGGDTWNHSFSGTLNDLNGVAFIDDEHGIAVGNNQTILQTTNGGITWSPVANDFGTDFAFVAFVDSRVAVITGMDGSIMRSTDGGDTWGRVHELSVPLLGISFSDRNYGAAVGKAMTILNTTDGGATWSGASKALLNVAMADEKTSVGVKPAFDSQKPEPPSQTMAVPLVKPKLPSKEEPMEEHQRRSGVESMQILRWRPFDPATMSTQMFTGAGVGLITAFIGSRTVSGYGGVIIGIALGAGVGYPIGVYLGGELRGGNGTFAATITSGPGMVLAGGAISLLWRPVGIVIMVLAPMIGPILGYHLSASPVYESHSSALFQIHSQGKIEISNPSLTLSHSADPLSSTNVQVNFMSFTF